MPGLLLRAHFGLCEPNYSYGGNMKRGILSALCLGLMFAAGASRAAEGDIYTPEKINTAGILYDENGKPELENIILRDKGNVPLTGEVVWMYPEGETLLKGSAVDGKLEGEMRYYRRNGMLWRVVNYAGGKLNGNTTEYYEDGNMKGVLPMKDGKLDGVVRTFYQDNGYLEAEIYYANGEMTGRMKIYNPDGSIKVER